IIHRTDQKMVTIISRGNANWLISPVTIVSAAASANSLLRTGLNIATMYPSNHSVSSDNDINALNDNLAIVRDRTFSFRTVIAKIVVETSANTQTWILPDPNAPQQYGSMIPVTNALSLSEVLAGSIFHTKTLVMAPPSMHPIALCTALRLGRLSSGRFPFS